MNELQRMHYLDAMGVESFVPRYVLPGAKPSLLCEIPAAAPPEAVDAEPLGNFLVDNEHDKDTGSERDNASQIIKETLSDTPHVQHEPEVVRDELPHVSKVSTDSVAFSLAVWRVSTQLLVLDSRQSGDALPTHALLGNMLTVLGLMAEPLPQAEILNWPLVKSPHDSSWSSAVHMVRGFLDGKLLSKPVEHMILCGAEAHSAVLGEPCDIPLPRYHTLPLQDFDCQAIVLPSLTEILYKPELKKDVWRALVGLSTTVDLSS